MAHKYTCTTPLHFALWDAGAEHELEAVFTYRVLPGCPASMDGPAEPASVEIDNVTVRTPQTNEDRSIPGWLHDALCGDEALLSHLMSEAAEADTAAAEQAADWRREELRDGRDF